MSYSGDDRLRVKGTNAQNETAYFVPDSSNEVIMFCATGLGFLKTILGSGWTLKDQILACTTVEQVNAIQDNR